MNRREWKVPNFERWELNLKSKALETAGCRVGKSGFGAAVFCLSVQDGGYGSCMSSVIEECEAI